MASPTIRAAAMANRGRPKLFSPDRSAVGMRQNPRGRELEADPSRLHIALHNLPRTTTPDDVRRLLQRQSIGNITNVQLIYRDFYPTGTAVLTLSGAQHYMDTMEQLQRHIKLYGHTLVGAPTAAPDRDNGRQQPEQGAAKAEEKSTKSSNDAAVVNVDVSEPAATEDSTPTGALSTSGDLVGEENMELQRRAEASTLASPEAVAPSGQSMLNAPAATLRYGSPAPRTRTQEETGGDSTAEALSNGSSSSTPETLAPSGSIFPAKVQPDSSESRRTERPAREAEVPAKKWTSGIVAGTGLQAGLYEMGRTVAIIGLPVQATHVVMRAIVESRGFTLDPDPNYRRAATGLWKVASPIHAFSSRFIVKVASRAEAQRLVREFHMTYHHKHLLQARVII